MNQFKISTRLMLLIGLMSTLLVLIGGIGLYGLQQSNRALKAVYQDGTLPLNQLDEIGWTLLRNRVLVMDMMVHPEPANFDNRNAELKKMQTVSPNCGRLTHHLHWFQRKRYWPMNLLLRAKFIWAKVCWLRVMRSNPTIWRKPIGFICR